MIAPLRQAVVQQHPTLSDTFVISPSLSFSGENKGTRGLQIDLASAGNGDTSLHQVDEGKMFPPRRFYFSRLNHGGM